MTKFLLNKKQEIFAQCCMFLLDTKTPKVTPRKKGNHHKGLDHTAVTFGFIFHSLLGNKIPRPKSMRVIWDFSMEAK